MTENGGPRVTIVGAGLAGLLMGVNLGRRGFRVSLYDKRSEAELLRDDAAGRAAAATLTGRAMRSLEEVGLSDSVGRLAVRLRGRVLRGLAGDSGFRLFPANDDQVYSIQLPALRERLLGAARAIPHVRVSFDRKCTLIDKSSGTACFEDERTGHVLRVASDFIVGADGSASKTRQECFRGEIAQFTQARWNSGYRVRSLPASEARALDLREDAINISGGMTRSELLWTLPNGDGSYTAFLIHYDVSPTLPKPRAGLLRTGSLYNRIGGEPDLPSLDGFAGCPFVRPLIITAQPWHFGRVVLIGGACHSEPPFFTSHVDEAFDDCRILSHCIDRAGSAFGAAFAEYESIRYRDVEALRRLSTLHYQDLWRHFQSPVYSLRWRMESSIKRLFPSLLLLHELPAQIRMTHLEAELRYEQQQTIMRCTGLSLALTVAGRVARSWNRLPKARTGAILGADRHLGSTDFLNARADGQKA